MPIIYAKEIRFFELGNLFKDKYRELRDQLRTEKLEINTRRSIADLAAQSVAVLALFGAFTYGIGPIRIRNVNF